MHMTTYTKAAHTTFFRHKISAATVDGDFGNTATGHDNHTFDLHEKQVEAPLDI